MTRLIDLSLELRDGLRTFPGGPKIAIMDRFTHEWSAGHYLPPAYSATDRILLLSEHTGTHVDAPYHFWKEGATIEQVALDRFWGTAVLADVSDRDPAEPVTAEHITSALAAQGETLRPNDVLLIRCWAGERDDPGFHTATALAEEVGAWAVNARAKAVGVDLSSVDNPGDRSFPVHMALLPAGIPIYENLCNLEMIERARFEFCGLPLRVAGGSASVVRAMAIIQD